jgi:hypothetical protein
MPQIRVPFFAKNFISRNNERKRNGWYLTKVCMICETGKQAKFCSVSLRETAEQIKFLFVSFREMETGEIAFFDNFAKQKTYERSGELGLLEKWELEGLFYLFKSFHLYILHIPFKRIQLS